MEKLTIKAMDFQRNEADQLVDFILQTKEGKFSDTKPVVVSFKRYEIEEELVVSDDYDDQTLLFGISN